MAWSWPPSAPVWRCCRSRRGRRSCATGCTTWIASSATLAYGLLTVLLGGGYASVVLGLGQLLGRDSNLVVATATLAVAAVFQPTRRRIQALVDRRFNRRRYDAAQTIQAFSARLRQQVDLDSLTVEVLAVVDQTMQPTQVSLWLRPPPPSSSDTAPSEARPTTWAY